MTVYTQKGPFQPPNNYLEEILADPDFAKETLIDAAVFADADSDDMQTQVGCIIIDMESGDTIAKGANALPRGVINLFERTVRPGKYKYMIHAEAKAILDLAGKTFDPDNLVMVVTHYPCADCARLILQSGIRILVVGDGETSMPHETFQMAQELFEEACVNVIGNFPAPPATNAHERIMSERERGMLEVAASVYGLRAKSGDPLTYEGSWDQIVALMQGYADPDAKTLSDLKINDYVDQLVQTAMNHITRLYDDNTTTPRLLAAVEERMGEVAREAALQVIMDKAAFLDNLANSLHAINVRAGWWTDLHTGNDLHGIRNVGELLALVHSEVSEASETQGDVVPHLVQILKICAQAIGLTMDQREAIKEVNEHLSRALEGWRKGDRPDEKLPHRPAFRVELVDALYRILDILGSDSKAQKEHPAGMILMEKIAYNHTREDHKPENRRKPGGKSV